MRFFFSVLWIWCAGCARMDVYYPASYSVDGKGDILGRSHNRAVVLNGTDSLGSTVIDVHASGVRVSSAGGFDNSTSTRIVTREVASVARYGISWGFMYGILKSLFTTGGNAYATHVNRPVTPSEPAPLPSVGSTIPAQTQAIVTPVP